MTGLAAALVLAALAADPAEPLAWPLDRPRELTSSFGEYRTGRQHAGIDLRTRAVGLPVRSPAGGDVVRVRCSPWGYGKAVYIRHDDGLTTVFAHLDDFMPALRDYVRAAQHAAQSYTVDLYPAAGAFRVDRGEIVAYSGQTGIGVPHLHYELRDEAARPINPRLVGVDWPDTTAPVIRKVAVIPRDASSQANGRFLPTILDAIRQPDGSYRTAPVEARGMLGFAVDVIDPANEGASILGVRTIETRVGDELVFRFVNDRISYDTITHGAVIWYPYLLDEGRFWNQFQWPGSRAEAHLASMGPGWWMVPAAGGEVVIDASDFLGNTARVVVPVAQGPETHREDANAAALLPAPGAARFEVAGAGDVLVWMTGGEVAERPLHVDAWNPETGSVRAFRSGQGGAVTLADGLRVVVPEGAPLGTLWLAADAQPGQLPASPLGTPGRAWRIRPENAPLAEAVRICIEAPEGAPDTLGAYRLTGDSWSPTGSRHESGAVCFSTRRLGTFALLDDTAAPRIEPLEPAEGAALATARPRIAARVTDIGSGIASADAWLDGDWLLMAWDPERSRLVWEQDADLPPGPHTLRWRVVDGAGNVTEREQQFAIEAAAPDAGDREGP